ncbi:MAG: hypothetical protein COY40_06295 [Alphaproteobacteria bacterium CG_4_10_14_0_8_um_filter_53_9]|nr:MAG: hypothetical protein COY40_06295 [Alphaproteobacteria bacterium CG_4_10_14_0_8_um_filter_53_9]
MYMLGYPLLSAAQIVSHLLLIYTFIIIAAWILAWANPDPLNPLVRILRQLTEPVMDKVRAYVPLIGGLDLTPLVVIIAISFVRTGVLPVVMQFARSML